MKRCYAVIFLFGAFLISGCATAPENIAPAYISHMAYMQYTVNELIQEEARLQSAVATASDAQRKARSNDTMGVILIGLPVSSLSGSNQASNLARLKGELEAVQKAIILKGDANPPVAASPAYVAKPISSPNNDGSTQGSPVPNAARAHRIFKNSLGLEVVIEKDRVIVATVLADSAGENAGIQKGDQITGYNGMSAEAGTSIALPVLAGAINSPLMDSAIVTWQTKDGPEKTAKLVW